VTDLRRAISVRAAYAFGDWPPASARQSYGPSYDPIVPRGPCRHCGLVAVYHSPRTGWACSELALRAAGGDR